MAYNLKSEQASYLVKLTAIGRQLLAQGTLTFTGFAVGDSEVDYTLADTTSTDLSSLQVLRPVDNQSDIRYPVLPTAGVPAIAPLSGKVGQRFPIQNAAPSRGPFRAPAPTSTADLYTQLDTTPPDQDGRVSVVRDSFMVTTDGGSLIQANKSVAAALPGDWLLVHWLNPQWTSPVQSLGSRYTFPTTNPGTYLLYRITEPSGSSFRVDRPTPLFSGGIASPAFVLPGGDAIENVYGLADPVLDWDEDQLAFVAAPPVASAQVGVWNCNIVYGETVMGGKSFPVADYPSNVYGGTRRYLGYPSVGSPVAILHYSNHVVHNLYGEGFVPATVQLTLPTVLWWGLSSGAGGITLTTGTTRRLVTGGSANFDLAYYPLQDAENRAVGRVYPTLKMVVLDDQELVAALSAKSNRNWTLPPFEFFNAGNSYAPSELGRGPYLSEPQANPTERTLHVTYALLPASNADGAGAYSYRPSLPCQYITRTRGGLAELTHIEFKLLSGKLAHLRGAGSATGAGYAAQRLVLFFQETQTGASPLSDSWVAYDFTGQLRPAVPSGTPLTAAALSGTYRISADELFDAQAAAAQNGGYYTLEQIGTPADGLTFGEETVLLGNLATRIESMTFRTSFLLNLAEGTYGTSTNPTWLAGKPVAITELGIYDVNNSLVAVAKLTDPIVKVAQQPLFLEVSLDF